jgi:hypothetical protein
MIQLKNSNDTIKNKVSNKSQDIVCDSCLKSLSEDMDLRGPGFIKIKNHQGNNSYICHICFKGF